MDRDEIHVDYELEDELELENIPSGEIEVEIEDYELEDYALSEPVVNLNLEGLDDEDIEPLGTPVIEEAPDEFGAPPLNVVFFAYKDMSELTLEEIDICQNADLIVSLGGHDLELLAKELPDNKPAVAILGPEDNDDVPQIFRMLHAEGIKLSDWRVAGFSGAVRMSSGKDGFYVSDKEAKTLLDSFPACDLLLSHHPPFGLESSRDAPHLSFKALTKYIQEKPPIYAFYAHPTKNVTEIVGDVLVVGVHGMLYPPPLIFS